VGRRILLAGGARDAENSALRCCGDRYRLDCQCSRSAFDCAKAKGQATTLICKDAGLAALDRQLDGVYKAALAKAKDQMPARLRSEQSGWGKGRDECWKAQGPANPVGLTLSWMAQDLRACVEGNYRMRISELQGKRSLVAGRWSLVAGRWENSLIRVREQPANEVVPRSSKPIRRPSPRAWRSCGHRLDAARRVEVRGPGYVTLG
jgi:uncharacterized protein YecT (DUF1311 family)